MRTKALLTIAGFAASALLASAQSNVYSVNIVGYVNQVIPGGEFAAVANPLDNGTNDLNSTFAALPNKSSAQFWNGSSFDGVTKGGGVWPAGDTPVGLGLFVRSGSAVTNTYVGEVIVGPGESVTNSLPGGNFVMVGSAIPYAGDLNDSNLNLALPNKSSIQLWNTTSKSFDGYTRGGGVWPANPGIAVGEGFFIRSASDYDWVQTLPAN